MKRPLDRAWELVELAREDLIAAKATLATGEAARVVCFHAQQAAEKALKALLTSHDLDYPWRHDLKELLSFGLADWPALTSWTLALDALTPYAVQTRYGTLKQPSQETGRLALDTAQEFYEMVKRLLEAEAAGMSGES